MRPSESSDGSEKPRARLAERIREAGSLLHPRNRRARLIRRIRKIGPWFHQIDLGDGIRTRDIAPLEGPQPLDHPRARWEDVKDAIPDDLSGLRVLDVGCADGYISVELARRGAKEVVAFDPQPAAIRRAALAKKHLGLKNISCRIGSVYDPVFDLGKFDIVFMLAVLYHLEDPMSGLRFASKLADVLCIESSAVDDTQSSHLHLRDPSESASHFRPKWIPTKKCLIDMLRWVGFQEIEELPCSSRNRAMYLCRKTT